MNLESPMMIPSFEQPDELFQLSPLLQQDDQPFQFDFDLFDNFGVSHQQPQDGNTVVTTNKAATDKVAAEHRRRRRDSAATRNNGREDKSPNDNKRKKTVHRDIERQRRQEMATLYSSLRSQLPFAYLKGKRSISDHIHQAVDYIKHLHKKIHDLKEKRDELKSLPNSTTPTRAPELPGRSGDTVVVKPSAEGVEVAVNTDWEMGIALSRVIGFFMAEGLNIVRCDSVKVNGRMLHSIEAEICNGSSSDNLCNELQEKLMCSLLTPGR